MMHGQGAAGGGDGVGEEVGDPAGPGDQYRGTPPLRSKKPQRPRSHNITEQVGLLLLAPSHFVQGQP